MNFIIRLIVSSILVMLTEVIVPGVSIESWSSALWVVVALSVLNAIVKPILQIFSFPITILTLGLFTLVINAIIVLLAEYFVSGFVVNGFFSALLFSIVLSVLQTIAGILIPSSKKK
ncbi:phage holin family protein [Paenimyroides tangerinum]|uniref:Phage holin family protein n=1 Tax=Paenimyroides tangerinum TaxID=2488728 RepID=A0A3P3W4B4_9FLAO|nr:phage holin family protein [Paenimyroides tangerinum]RRJ89915.1 phage holin family protein [Paenimyroides tangerinum]